MENFQVREAVVDLLVRIEQDSGFSHLLIDHEIKSRNIPPKDEALMTEIVYGTIQRKLTLDYYLEGFVDIRKKIKPWVRMLLRMSVYQMQYLDKVPDHAVIHEAVEIAKHRGHKGIASFVNGVLRSLQRKGIPDTTVIPDKAERLAVETSHPEWLVKRWIDMYGFDITYDMCHANLERKPSSIRIQPLKITREAVMDELHELGFETRKSDFSNQGVVIDHGNILRTRLFEQGYVTIQDQSSMLVTEMLDADPGMTVLDACSAPGGKVTHTAEKMENEGSINAYDLHAKKAKQIQKKAAELDLTIIDAKVGDARKLQEQHEKETFDRILIDAPCTGFGVIRGKPDIKYNKQKDNVGRLARIQADILDHVAPLLKKGGLLIYSTCTVDKTENDDIAENFLARNPNFIVDPGFFEQLPAMIQASPGCSEIGLQLFPQTFSTDGFFMTRIKRV
ncbi:16S rRNA (cytosine(967)-C(5))-methyltransferase RsmB [Lentibacillus sp. CBA3610]|uniref:16S rRNA (cytosine(967)-C(5))-methyltransferase RsmB n=1 Tax=Lentibacillus sp. CBA3610 TaxID=2518176 RepID=UPI0015954DB2|nr:16S rRNA (cytosine(967)-C(5))-methyltransferase RsmB [Lentibacillus sp. CBA3610]QKY68990.1 16S rRNA (cytosine(967)-C(5))-methyltransferase RsmB [Lentibacillus sp. CBA3610]